MTWIGANLIHSKVRFRQLTQRTLVDLRPASELLHPPRLHWPSGWWEAIRAHGDFAPLGRALLLVLFFRYLLMPAVGFIANITFPLEHPETFTVFDEPNYFWDMFARYDSGWYYSIARDGYRYTAGEPNNLGFFPLYPLAMRGIGWILGGEQHHYYLAGMLVSRVAFLGALIVLYYLARLDLDAQAAQRAVVYVAVFPFSFFFSRVYSESLFLFLTLLAFYFFRTRRWELGGLGGAFAALTRVNGILSVAALACIAIGERSLSLSNRIRAVLALALIVGGFAVFCIYAYAVSGSPFGWLHAIRSWQYEPGGAPWVPLIALVRQLVRRPYDFLTVEPNGPYDVLNGVTAGVFVLSIPFVWRRFGAGYAVHMLVNLWLPLSSGHFEGLGRYCAVLFPFFLWLASFRSDLVRDTTIFTFVALYVLCLSLFIKLHPIF